MGQKLQKGTREEIASILEKGKWPHVTPPLLKLLLYISPCVYVGYWEYCRYKKCVINAEHKRKEFKGDTPFYGKAWGNTTDYLIEQSLRDGDLLFLSYDEDSLHLHTVIAKLIFNKLSDSVYDDVGIVVMINGICHVALLSCFGGIKLVKYADLLANEFPLLVSVRRLICEDNTIRQKIKKAIFEEKETTFSNAKGSKMKQLFNAFRRNQNYAKSCFFGINEYLMNEWKIHANNLIITRLKDLLKDLEALEALEACKKKKSSFFLAHFFVFFNKKSDDDGGNQKRKENNLALIQKRKAQISELIDMKEKEITMILSLQEKTLLEKGDLVTKKSQKKFFITKKYYPTQTFVASVLQKAGVLPPFPPFYMYTTHDLLSLQHLCNGESISSLSIDTSAAHITPRFSNIFHIRQDQVEKQQFEKAFSKKIPQSYK